MFLNYLFLLLGFLVLMGGAEVLIKGATSIALSFGVSTLIVGLTVVAFGTSAPELFVSIRAAWGGAADVAVGNIIGSNIFNILVIIGVSAVIKPISSSRAVLVREMPIMIGVLGVFYLFSMDGKISRFEGGILFSGIIVYLIMNYILAKKGKVEVSEDADEKDSGKGRSTILNLGLVIIGLCAMVYGARWIVDNATVIAKFYNVSDLVIGITLVAVGTSLPELATTLAAARKGQVELAVGNGIGSNIFNVLCVIGLTALILPLKVNQAAISFDLPFMFFGCFAVLPLMIKSRKLSRFEGLIMLAAYGTYICFLLMGKGGGQ